MTSTFVSRLFGVYAKPTSSEDRFISELERRFPGSEWIEPLSASTPSSDDRNQFSHQLKNLVKSLDGSDDRIPAPASAGGTGARMFDYAVIGSGKVLGPALEKWLKKIPAGASITCPPPRARKDGTPMNTEALLVELRPDVHATETRPDLYAQRAADVAVEEALRRSKEIVLIGTGNRVTYAKDWLKRVGSGAPPVTILEG